MNKKLFALALSLGLTATAAGAITANAAIKETNVGDNVITSAGIVNELDWKLVGNKEAFAPNVQGDLLQAKDVPWATGYFSPWDKVSFADGPVTMEFDVLYMEGGSIAPFVGTFVTEPLDLIWLSGASGIIDTGAHSDKAGIEYYADEAMTTAKDGGTNGGNCWFYPIGTVAGEVRYHLQFIFKQDGTMGIRSYALNDDGTYGTTPYAEVWIKNAFDGKVDGTTEYHFGVRYFGSLTIDNFKLSNATKTVFETDCSGSGWNENEGVPTAGKMYNSQAKPVKVAHIEAKPTKADRMVSELEIATDENCAKAFTLSGAIDFRTLGEFGLAMGLETQDQAFDAEGVSYLYFTQDAGITYLNLMEDGEVVGTPIALGDMVTGDFFDFEFTVNTDGTATLTAPAGSVPLTLKAENLDGYFAMGTNGTDAVEVAINYDVKLVGYAYRASDGEKMASNFNTGWVNPEKWEVNSVNAVKFADPTEAKGIVVEDGKVKFAGTADGSYFGTTEEYADFVLEFLYEEAFKEDKPELAADWVHGHSPLAVIVGVNTAGGGWAKGSMIIFKDGNIQMQDFKHANGAVTDGAIDYNFSAAETGKTKTTAIKMVVASNKITVYYQEVVEGTAPTAEAYVKGAEFTTGDTYGRVTFATTEAGYFNLDDIRVTPIDDPDAEKVAANAAAYVSFEAIADEHRPYDLDAPVITMNEKVISWTAVEGATGYVVNVNGTKTEVGADVLSYTVTATEAGDYTITVMAKGNGDWIGDSDQSNAVEFTIEAPKPAKKAKKGGCGSFVAGGSILTIAAAAGIALVAKKRKED